MCFLCGEKLANSGMKPGHLQRHCKTKHACHVRKPFEVFKRKLYEFRPSQATMHKPLEDCCVVSLFVAKAEKPSVICEFAVVLAETALDKKAAAKLNTLSNGTACWRVDEMGTDCQASCGRTQRLFFPCCLHLLWKQPELEILQQRLHINNGQCESVIHREALPSKKMSPVTWRFEQH